MFVTIEKINKNKWQKPMPAVKNAMYALRQMFNPRFLQ